MTSLGAISGVADRARRAGWRTLFGPEWETATFAHWSAQWYPSLKIAEVQWDALTQLVAYAREASPFYRRRLAALEAGANLTPEALRRIPPLSRADLVASAAAIEAASAHRGPLRRQSGGTGGPSLSVPIDRATYCWYIAGTWRGLRWWGTDLTDRGAILLGAGGTGLRWLAVRVKDWLTNWLRLPVTDRFDRHAQEIVERVAAFGAGFIYGYPSAVHRLARAVRMHGWRPRRKLKVVVLTGEPLYLFQRNAIEATLQCPVAEEYGNGELGSMAFQCPYGSLHVTAENVFLEMVQNGPLGGGGEGVILATQLRNRLFPLIRYDTGDIGVLSAASCRCQRELPTIRIVGRSHERLVGTESTVLARPRIEALLNALPRSLQGRVQVAHPEPARIVLRMERDSTGTKELAEAAAIGAETLGPAWHISVVEVDGLARLPSGKLPYFLRSHMDEGPAHH